LEIKIKEGSLIRAPKRASTKKKRLSQSKAFSSQAVELVKNHPTPGGSVEKRRWTKRQIFSVSHMEIRSNEIGGKNFRVLQYVEERSVPPFVRTWTVDLSTRKVRLKIWPPRRCIGKFSRAEPKDYSSDMRCFF